MKIFDFKKKAKQAEEGEYTTNWVDWDTYSSSEALTYADMEAAVKFLEEMPKPTAYVLPVSPEILQELKNADYIGFQSFINGGVVFPNLKKTPSLHPRGIDKFDHLLEEG